MSWTDDRVATLTKMWKDGRSAAEIAKELGGVTRNAVIGKAHRLGLSGRASPIKKKKEAAKKTAKTTTTKKTKTAAPKKSAAKKKAEPASDKQQKLVMDAIKEAVAEAPSEAPTGGIGLLQLTERVCKWPIGDPQESDFHFCGMPSMASLPYCEDHAAMAYQTPRKAGGSKTKGSLKIVGDKSGKKETAKSADDEDEDLDIEDLDSIDVSDDDDDDDGTDVKNAG